MKSTVKLEIDGEEIMSELETTKTLIIKAEEINKLKIDYERQINDLKIQMSDLKLAHIKELDEQSKVAINKALELRADDNGKSTDYFIRILCVFLAAIIGYLLYIHK